MQASPAMDERDIEMGRLHSDHFQEVNELRPLLDSTTDMIQNLKASPAMGERDIEMGPLHSDNTSARGTQHHFQEITEFRALLDRTTHIIQNLKAKGRMDEDIDEVQKMAPTMKAKLSKLIRNNVENRKNPECEQGTYMDISRMKVIISFKKKLIQRKKDLQIVAAVEEIKERCTAGMDLNQKLLELQQEFAGMVSSVDVQEKVDKEVMNKVRENLDGELVDGMERIDAWPCFFVTCFLVLGLVVGPLLILAVTSG